MSRLAVETFEQMAIGLRPQCPKTIAALLAKGLIEKVGERVLCRDRFGTVTIPEYAVPLPVHYQWCKWCDENIKDIAELEAELDTHMGSDK
jgi:hypothetical protein